MKWLKNKYAIKIQLFQVVVFLLVVGCTTKKVTQNNLAFEKIAINNNFEKESINSKVYFSTNFNFKHQSNKTLRETILSTFKKNNNPESVEFSFANKNPKGWIYFEIENKATIAQSIVINIDHRRTDKIIEYVLEHDTLSEVAEVERQTPLKKRYLPFIDFSFPVTLKTNETKAILLYSERHFGMHETSIALLENKEYVLNAVIEDFVGRFQIAFYACLMIFIFVIGVYYHIKKLIYFSLYLCGLINLFAANYTYSDLYAFSPYIVLNASNFSHFSAFIINILFHPFGFYIFKDAVVNHKKYIFWAKALVSLNLLFLLTFLLPKSCSNIVMPVTTIGLAITIFLGIGWVSYFSIMLYLKKNIKRYLLISLLAFGPILLKFFLGFLYSDMPLTQLYNFSPLLVIFFVGYLTFEELKSELVVKRVHNDNLSHLKNSLETLRKGEIEQIGRNLHDQVGNTLASALGYLNMKDLKTETIKDLILNAIKELRFLSHNLVKDNDEALTDKVEMLVSRFNDFSSTTFYFNDYSDKKINALTFTKQQSIYIIIQELMTNIIKHANAKEAYIQFFVRDNHIQVNIEDDGVGFDTAQENKGIGLKNIFQRALLSNLTIIVDSTSNGTSVIIKSEDENNSDDN